jgi:protein tyrosine phosphatase
LQLKVFISPQYFISFFVVTLSTTKIGPLETTRYDFWKMVAETNSTMIVMVTKLTEGGKVLIQFL